jgi:uncharacterized HAD superfamily protein
MTGKTYFMDIDGTIVENLSWEELEKHNEDPDFIQMLLPGVERFFRYHINEQDIVIFTTARSEQFREMTKRTLKYHNIEYKNLIMDLTSGERYLVNDTVNMFYPKSIAINVLRNTGFGDTFIFDPEF